MVDIQLTATVNGRKVSRAAKPHLRLLDFLRDDLNLTGNKEGCGAGECGTCSVFVGWATRTTNVGRFWFSEPRP